MSVLCFSFVSFFSFVYSVFWMPLRRPLSKQSPLFKPSPCMPEAR